MHKVRGESIGKYIASIKDYCHLLSVTAIHDGDSASVEAVTAEIAKWSDVLILLSDDLFHKMKAEQKHVLTQGAIDDARLLGNPACDRAVR